MEMKYLLELCLDVVGLMRLVTIIAITLGAWPTAYARSDFFVNYALAVIDIANTSTSTKVVTAGSVSLIECGVRCHQNLVCAAFSLKPIISNGSIRSHECRFALGTYTWTPDPDGKLMAARMENLRNYTFARDGAFYKYFPGNTSMDLVGTRRACMNLEQADVPVAYPKAHYDAVIGTPGAAGQSYWLGSTRTGTAVEGRWVTDDGVVFNSNNKSVDADQKWSRDEPSNGTAEDSLAMGADGLSWIARGSNAFAKKPLCRRDTMYRRSPVNGKYYRAYRHRLSYAEAQTACEADGGSLANVVTELDWNATEQFRLRTKGFTGSISWTEGFWIAGTDSAVEGMWWFPDGTVLDALHQRATDPIQMRFFWPGEPNGYVYHNCLTLLGKAMDNDCAWRLQFLCQIPPA